MGIPSELNRPISKLRTPPAGRGAPRKGGVGERSETGVGTLERDANHFSEGGGARLPSGVTTTESEASRGLKWRARTFARRRRGARGARRGG